MPNPQGWTGFMTPGGFQQRLVAPIDRLTVVPDEIDPVHAAPLTCAIGTAYRAVTTRGRITPGSRVVVIGLGGVGIHALQTANAAGARVTGIDVSPRALEVAPELGLEALAAEDPAAEERISELSATGGIDVVIDTVGSEATLAQAFRLVRAGGRIVGVGYAVDSNIVLPTARFVLEEVELVGSRYVALDEFERAMPWSPTAVSRRSSTGSCPSRGQRGARGARGRRRRRPGGARRRRSVGLAQAIRLLGRASP